MLFCYGTLRFDAVLEALLGRIPSGVPVDAPGWRAAALAKRVYPGLVPAPGSTAPGLLLTDLSRREWAILNAFEDERYDLRPVALASGQRAWAYIWPGDDVLPANWDKDLFEGRHLLEYATRCRRIAPTLSKNSVTPSTASAPEVRLSHPQPDPRSTPWPPSP
ncbi:gamma-glutamylcyclotransferase family protein [Streptomyces sp. NPDC058953]|uniref:gamma-glutamylcyclotransferase family protein n=1 Tax=unclassified Streptomyces TaxID=2593676 RepID=UPI003677CD92